jgi:hypothetical protein
MTDGMQFNRRAPALLLGIVLAVLALHHWYVVTEHNGFLIVMFLLPPFGMLALGGLIYPPILRSLGEEGKTMRAWVRAVGVLLAVIGLGIGVYLFKVVYRF